MKNLLKSFFLASCFLFLGSATKAQVNSNGVLTGFPFYYNTQNGAGGIAVNGNVLNCYYPANLVAGQTVMFPGTYESKKVEAATNTTDTLYTATHATVIDSVHGNQTITFYANQYVTPGAVLNLHADINPGDTSAWKLYVKFGSAAVDTLTLTNTYGVYRTYTFTGVTLQPWNK